MADAGAGTSPGIGSPTKQPTGLTADSVEWCPYDVSDSANGGVAAVCTYQLDKETGRKHGSVMLANVAWPSGEEGAPDVDLKVAVETEAVLDAKWAGNLDPSGAPQLACAETKGRVEVFSLASPSSLTAPAAGPLRLQDADDACIALALDWEVKRSHAGEPARTACGDRLWVSRTDGCLSQLCRGEGGSFQESLTVRLAHEYDWGGAAEVWIVAAPWCDGGPADCVWSGGDDGILKGWDPRACEGAVGGRQRPLFKSREHGAGVCSAQFHPADSNTVATGSYDQNVFVWDRRNVSAGPVSRVDTGGGVWRLKWHPHAADDGARWGGTLGAACMRGGAAVIDAPLGEEAGAAAAEMPVSMWYKGHESEELTYGLDWCRAGERSGNDRPLLGTCCFYGAEVHCRTYEDELRFIDRVGPCEFRIKPGCVPNMNVPGTFFVNEHLEKLMFEELRHHCKTSASGSGGFLPAIKQIANVAALPGIVRASIGLPDVHSGYGFAIGNVAAFDMMNPEAVVSPGGVGFDINCGVRLLRTNLFEKDVRPVQEQLTQALFDHIPVGVGSKGIIPTGAADLEAALEMGMDWSLREGYAWAEDKEHCEEFGRMLAADPSKVSKRAKKRGLPQLGTLGAGNHYAEIQVVDEVFDKQAAGRMGIDQVGQVVVMIHSGSRGLGHQVATDALVRMETAMARDGIATNDRQLACARIDSEEGRDYLASMSAAANYAWVNRSSMTFLTRQAFAKQFNTTPDDLDMHVVYDVSHNIAKVEEHMVDGTPRRLLVHRKGSTRAFPPHHPLIPVDYQFIGQPVLIGGSMGTCSYVLTGTQKGMDTTFGSTCHGAGRATSRAKSRRTLDYEAVLGSLERKRISIRVASPKLVMEEAPESYKDVTAVVDTCQAAGISNKCVKLRPIAVVKG